AQDTASFVVAAERIGYPVLVKASAGGGGRGMRVAEREAELFDALTSARREAEAAFGAGRLLLEKYLARPRHIEVQVFADNSGNAIHLYERDCSVQRRHQKIIEEAPAPGLDARHRAMLGAYAVTAAQSAGYAGAGTVEFIAAEDAFFFIEMNTRLQVEHPVTEMITGLDLVEWQLRIAAGEDLPLDQRQITTRGHAVEARLYAEDPARDFLPQSGRLARLYLPRTSSEIRVETGVSQGDTVGVQYDALLAKFIGWGEDRSAAIAKLRAALAESRVVGVVTNRDFLLAALAHPEFAAGAVDTGFLTRHRAALLPPAQASFAALAAASVALFERLDQHRTATDPHSPWKRRDGWRLFGVEPIVFHLIDEGMDRWVRLAPETGGVRIDAANETAFVTWRRVRGRDLAIELNGQRIDATVLCRRHEVTVALAAETRRFDIVDPLAPRGDASVADGLLAAPMPGKVLAVHASVGERVGRGQLLMVLEAMKMEHGVIAPADGVIEAVHYRVGDLVEEGARLISFTVASGSD
ncbi:MAG: biotin/lipoyl-containing protein, partial [Stellaceae bacterium]